MYCYNLNCKVSCALLPSLSPPCNVLTFIETRPAGWTVLIHGGNTVLTLQWMYVIKALKGSHKLVSPYSCTLPESDPPELQNPRVGKDLWRLSRPTSC